MKPLKFLAMFFLTATVVFQLSGQITNSGGSTYSGIIAGWDVHGLSTYGASPLAPTTNAPDISVAGLSRGSGLTTAPTAAARAWGANGWPQTTTSGVAANQFLTFSLTSTNGGMLSISNISRFDYRHSSTGPASGLLQVQIGNGAFTDLTNLSFPVNTSSGASLGVIDLSGFSGLQNIPANNTVTFRLINYGASSAAGTWYIYDFANSTALDFSIAGALSSGTTGLAPVIVQPPVGTNVLMGQTVSFFCNVTGSGPLKYAWLKNALPIADATNSTLTLSNVSRAFAGNYSITISNAYGFTNSAEAVLVVTNQFSYPIDNGPGFFGGENLNITNSAGGAWFVWSSSDLTLPVTAWNPEGPTVEFPITGTSLSRYGLTVTPTSSPTYYIFGEANSGPYLPSEPYAQLTTIDQVAFTVIVSNSPINSAGVFQISAPPVITTQPSDINLFAGKTTNFSVACTGTVPLTYQWREDGIALTNNSHYSGVTSATLLLVSAATNHTGGYSVVVSNFVGSTTSRVASLTVFNLPVLFLQNKTNGIIISAIGGVVSNTVFLQMATNLTPPVTWFSVQTNVVDGIGNVQFVPTNTGAAGFFRLQIP